MAVHLYVQLEKVDASTMFLVEMYYFDFRLSLTARDFRKGQFKVEALYLKNLHQTKEEQ